MRFGFAGRLPIRLWIVLVAWIASVPISAVVLRDDLRDFGSDVREAEHACADAVRDLAARQEGLTAETRRMLATAAQFPEVQRLDAEASNRLFARLLAESSQYSAIQVSTPEGQLAISARPFPEPITIVDRKYYQDVLRTRAFSVGEYVTSRTAHRPAIHFAAPAFGEKGELVGVVHAAVDLQRLALTYGQPQLPRGSVVVVTDYDGTILYRAPSQDGALGRPDEPAAFARMKGGSPEGSFTSGEATARLMVYRQLRLRPEEAPYMYVRAEVPYAEVTREAKAGLVVDLVVLAGAWLLAFLGAWLVGERLVARRLRAVGEAAAKLAQGDLAARTAIVHDRSEIGRLAQAFDAMGAAIQEKTTSLERAQAERREGERFLATTLQSIGDAVIVADEQGRLVRMNPVAEQLTGIDLASGRGKKVAELLTLRDSQTGAPAECPIVQALALGTPVALGNHVELVARDGTIRQIADSAAPIREREGGPLRGVVMVFRDVTERYRLEEQVRHAQRMETVGRLAGGVAHDFNNLLVSMVGGSELISRAPGLDPEMRQLAVDVRESAERAAELTRSLLALSRRQSSATALVDMHQTIEGALRVLQHSMGQAVTLERQLQASHAMVRGDATLLQSVVLNLAINARDAMPTGGTLKVSTRDTAISSADVAARYPGLTPGDYLELELRDTGMGMSRDVLSRIFEPFFTTKPAGKGTGLGLAVAYGTVRSHGGWIGAQSVEGRGSTFTVLLPLATGEAVASLEDEALPRGEGRVLVVDDEPSVRNMAQRLLMELGYEVSLAVDGEDAVRIFQEAKGAFVAVVLDVLMPKMDGIATFEALRAIDPSIPVVFSSGYHDNPKVQDLVAKGAAAFLAKPYRAAAIAAIVAKAMRQKTPAGESQGQ